MTEDPIVTWKAWQDGIADSPHVGNALLQGVEIDKYAGSARVAKQPVSTFHAALSVNFTADAATNICSASTTSIPQTQTAVTFTTTGTLPAGLSTGTVYFLIRVTSSTFKVATTMANAVAGTAIDITDAGTGTHTVVSVDPGTVNHFVTDPRTGTQFCIDSNGRVWYNTSSIFLLLYGNTLTNASGQGLAIFRVSDGSATYLFAFRNASIDVVNVYGSTQLEAPSWSNAWKSMNTGAGTGNSHHAKVGQDNIVYFCDDRYVGSIKENAGSVFDPASAGTYTYNNQALDLPLGSLTYWLEELGVNLLVSVSNDSFIYPWDRTSDSYGLPLPIGEYGGNKMKNIGNIVYVLAGTKGNVYWTQGTYVRLFKTIPTYLTNNSTTVANGVTWGGIAAAEGRLIVGLGATSGRSGVYMMDANGRMTVDNVPSTGAARATALYATTEFYQMGYAGGADTMDSSRYSAFGVVIMQSQLYRLGNKTEKATISQIEYQIANGISSGSASIRVGYRADLTSAYTTLATFTVGSGTSDNADVGLTNLENVQFQVEMYGSLDFMELRAYK